MNLSQIPATVIDKGVLRDVPYISCRYRDVELNVYGDPDSPAGIEMGLYGASLSDSGARRRCREHIAALLGDPHDRAVVSALGSLKEMKSRAGLTFEITPGTEEDAYGAWWISVYDEKKLDTSRATQKELAEISIPKREVSRLASPSKDDDGSWTRDDLKYARPVRPVTIAPVINIPVHEERSAPTYSSSTVYVRGYTRKDGTYVRAHTRRR